MVQAGEGIAETLGFRRAEIKVIYLIGTAAKA
jgi:hypothetical protein